MATVEATELAIDISNVGPIEHLHIPLTPGVTVLKGVNGSGKSQALRGIERLAGNDKIKTPIRDGAKKSEIEGCGVHIVVGGRVNKVGELEVESLEGKFDLAKLVDPGIQDPVAADAARIKALLKLLELPVDESIWVSLFDNEENYRAAGVELTGDVVTDAGRVKRALESQARKHETEAERLSGQFATRIADLNEFDESVERDSDKLQAELEAAITEKSTLDERRKNADAQAWRRKQAQEKLAELPESNLDALKAECDITQSQFNAQAETVAMLKLRIAELQNQLKEETTKYQSLENQLAVAGDKIVAEKQRIAEREQFEKILEAEAEPGPTDESIVQAAARVQAARELAEIGVKARMADRHAAEAKQLKADETAHRKQAVRLREAAKSTDEILSDMVAKLDVGLIVYEGRLSMKTDRGTTPEPFGELSQGERSRVATEICALRVGRGGLVPLAQELWEGLDPINKREVAETAKRHGVYVIAAEAAEGDLRAESFN